jgi:L-fucose mutarotase
VHGLVQDVLDEVEKRPVAVEGLERHAFYAAARQSFAIVRTSDPGPYGCFILRKGVIDLPRNAEAPRTTADGEGRP